MEFIGYVDHNTKEISQEYSRFGVFWEGTFHYLIDLEVEGPLRGPSYISVENLLEYHYLLEGVGD